MTTLQVEDLQADLCDRLLMILSSGRSPLNYSEIQKLEEVISTLSDVYSTCDSFVIPITEVKALKFWLDAHHPIEQLRACMRYRGPAGGWKAHKRSLRELSWTAHYKPHIIAHRELHKWARKSKEQGKWLKGNQFDQDLATVFSIFIQDPSCDAEDLVGGFKEYNQELFAWFNLGTRARF